MKRLLGYIVAFFIGMIVCLLITYTDNNEGKTTIERDTIFETITIEKPVPVLDTIVKHITRSPIFVHDTTFIERNDTDIYITPDTQVVIPITQKVYEDSTYKAWVSGYMPSLDRLEIYRPTITITKYNKKRFTFGPQFGAGVDVITGRFALYAGFGGSYNF